MLTFQEVARRARRQRLILVEGERGTLFLRSIDAQGDAVGVEHASLEEVAARIMSEEQYLIPRKKALVRIEGCRHG